VQIAFVCCGFSLVFVSGACQAVARLGACACGGRLGEVGSQGGGPVFNTIVRREGLAHGGLPFCK
jgi:hypothetical protein